MWRPTYGNCLLFAVVNWLLYGGSILSYRWLPIPHFMWKDKHGKTWSYTTICKYHKGNPTDFASEVWFKGAAVRKFWK